MLQPITYSSSREALLTDLSFRLGIGTQDAISKAKLIADSYTSARAYAGTDAQAMQLVISGSKKQFGVQIDDFILSKALQYVNEYEGAIASDNFITWARTRRASQQTAPLDARLKESIGQGLFHFLHMT